jgi:glycosyltransferase involved in cell wall biosynthesis
MLRVGAVTGGLNNPSARYRVRNYTLPMLKYRVAISEYPATLKSSPPKSLIARPMWGVASMLLRLGDVVRATLENDIILFQRELISTLHTYERFRFRPSIFDVDDAIWLYRNGSAANAIAEKVNHVICGNEYIAEHFAKYNSNVSVIPTTIDTTLYEPVGSVEERYAGMKLGWSGTSGGYSYFSETLQRQIAKFLLNNVGWKFHVMSDFKPAFEWIPEDLVVFTPWTAQTEASVIASYSIGIMPLDQSNWSRGKCSYKLLQYMACGVPSAASAVGMNLQVLDDSRFGYSVHDDSTWFEALNLYAHDFGYYKEVAANSRMKVLKQFSCANNVDKLFRVFESL